jgi:hypothetical protein
MTGKNHRACYIAKDEEIMESIFKHKGIVYYVADELGYTRNGIETRIRNSPALQEAVKQARQTVIDEGEKALFEKLSNKEWKAVEFTLRKLGKDRGYGDSQEINMNANIQANVTYDLSRLSTEELETLNGIIIKISVGEDTN